MPDQNEINNTFKVFARIKPINQNKQTKSNLKQPFHYDQNYITFNIKDSQHTFLYDKIHGPTSSQQQVFYSVAVEAIDSAFIGINSTILCYGQSLSGKSHTMIGDLKQNSFENEGLIPRVLKQITSRKNYLIQGQNKSMLDIRIKITMIEIYNQKIIDLFNPQKKNLKIRQSRNQGVFVHGLTEKYIYSAQEGIKYLLNGLKNRNLGRGNENYNSSRSHFICSISIMQTNYQKKQSKSGKITLADLGSQCFTGPVIEGKLLQETKKSNLSLVSLRKTISLLTEGQQKHIPYRESKLTRVLKQSLGGNSLTVLIINISPYEIDLSQTLTSIKFGAKAKQIKNQPKINKQYTNQQLLELLEKAQRKINQLTKYIKFLERNLIESRQQDKTKKLDDFYRNQMEYRQQSQDTKSIDTASKLSEQYNSSDFSEKYKIQQILNELQGVNFDSPQHKLKKSQSQFDDSAKNSSLDKTQKSNVSKSEIPAKSPRSLNLLQKSFEKKISLKSFLFYDRQIIKEQPDHESDYVKNEYNKQSKLKSPNKNNKQMEESSSQQYQRKIKDKSYLFKHQNLAYPHQFCWKCKEKNKSLESYRLNIKKENLDLKQKSERELIISTKKHTTNQVQQQLTQQQRKFEGIFTSINIEFVKAFEELKKTNSKYKDSLNRLHKYKSIIKQQHLYIVELKDKQKQKKIKLTQSLQLLQRQQKVSS